MSPVQADMTCSTCAYYHPEASPRGECRRYAPRPFPSFPLLPSDQGWPVVGDNDWCGEYKSAPPGVAVSVELIPGTPTDAPTPTPHGSTETITLRD